MRSKTSLRALLLVGFLLPATAVSAQEWPFSERPSYANRTGPKILSIQAHPDDETIYSATLYTISHMLRGPIDVALITDGSGGFDYAMVAEPLHQKPLWLEPEAREYLPAVRKEEFLRAGKIFGLRNVFFLDEYDHRYMLDADTVLQHVWDVEHVRMHLDRILKRGDYDFVFTLLPLESEHGHHKAASILALEAVRALPEAERPAVLGSMFTPAGEEIRFTGLPSYPLTKTTSAEPAFTFDRRRSLEEDSVLTFQVVVNWHLAEYKSQGVTQTMFEDFDIESFWLYDLNNADARDRARRLFDRLNRWPP